MAGDEIIEFKAAGVGLEALDVVVLHELRAVGHEVAGLALEVGGEDRRVKGRARELAVHHQLLEHRLPERTEAHDHAGIILLGPAVRREADGFPRGAHPDQGARDKHGRIEDIDIAEAVAGLGYLEHRGDDVLRSRQGDARFLRLDLPLLQRRLEPQGEEQILVLGGIERVDRELAGADVQPAHGPVVAGDRVDPGHHGHARVIEIAHQGLGGAVREEDHRAVSRLQALLAQSNALFVDAVDQREVAAVREQEAELAHGLGPDGVDGGARDREEREQVHHPEAELTEARRYKTAARDGGHLVDAEEHAQHEDRRTHRRHQQVARQLHIAGAVVDQPAEHRDDEEHGRQSAEPFGLERHVHDHGEHDRGGKHDRGNDHHVEPSLLWVGIGSADAPETWIVCCFSLYRAGV